MKKLLFVFAALVCCSCSFTQDTTVVTPVMIVKPQNEQMQNNRQKICIYVPPNAIPMSSFDMKRYDAIPPTAVTQKMLMMVAYIEYLRRRDLVIQDSHAAALTIYNNCLRS